MFGLKRRTMIALSAAGLMAAAVGTVAFAETPTPTATPTGTATPPVTATATVPPSSNGNGGCNMGDGASLDRRSLGLQVALAAAIWLIRRRRSGAD